MKPVASIYIPYAPHHTDIRLQAIASAERQTVKCKVLSGLSPNTPATFRNTAKFADTPFVTMLDADDTLAPTFVEECLEAYEKGRYVFTNWMAGSELRKANICAKYDEGYRIHLVTTLYPTAIFKELGGFNERLEAFEDFDFYMRSAKYGICGLHLDKPLVNYTQHGQRSLKFIGHNDKRDKIDEIWKSNGGDETIMGCCGQPGTQATVNPGVAQPGDIQAEALWAGMRSEYSLATGRLYVGGNGSVLNVAPEDVANLCDRVGTPLFRAVRNLRDLAPDKTKVLKESGLV